jgi:hypothetical protein
MIGLIRNNRRWIAQQNQAAQIAERTAKPAVVAGCFHADPRLARLSGVIAVCLLV